MAMNKPHSHISSQPPAPAAPELPSETQLSVRGLRINLSKDGGETDLVKGISFDIRRGETVCLVGESGCGKSVTALAIIGLLQQPPLRIAAGQILMRDGDRIHDLAAIPPRGTIYRSIRGRAVSMIFQEPMSSLNPSHRNGKQIVEVIRAHTSLSEREAWTKMLEILEMVGISDPVVRARQYPHQLSGGMRQRIMIAIAMACDPMLLLADEPTTALDVTTQAQILRKIRWLSHNKKTGTLFITHDLGVVAQLADTVHVMYRGEIVESADVRELFRNPRHPYTRGLLTSIPSFDFGSGRSSLSSIHPIPGSVSDTPKNPLGCAFQPRCAWAMKRCENQSPPPFDVPVGHMSRCWLEAPRDD